MRRCPTRGARSSATTPLPTPVRSSTSWCRRRRSAPGAIPIRAYERRKDDLMGKKIGLAAVMVSLTSLAMAVAAGASTAPAYGATCNAAWSGKRGTHDYRTYKKACMTAAMAATQAAHTAGDNDDAVADASRAVV